MTLTEHYTNGWLHLRAEAGYWVVEAHASNGAYYYGSESTKNNARKTGQAFLNKEAS